MSNIFVLPDLHLPFTDFKKLEEAARLCKALKCKTVVQLGDIIDGKAWSRFQIDPEDDSPALEFLKIQRDMKKLNALFPNLIILLGNHCTRSIKKAIEARLPKQMVKRLEELFPYPKWKWYLENKPLVIEGITFMHGNELPGTIEMKLSRMGGNIVYAHSHQASIKYLQSFKKRIWALEAGCIINPDAAAFNYAARNPKRSVISCAAIIEGVPHIFPL